jgi:hypothetical protein
MLVSKQNPKAATELTESTERRLLCGEEISLIIAALNNFHEKIP